MRTSPQLYRAPVSALPHPHWRIRVANTAQLARPSFVLRVFPTSAMLCALVVARAAAIDLPPFPFPYSAGAQSTVVWQDHPTFHSPYEGPNSLRAEHEDAVSHSYSLYAGMRPFPWLEVYLNPEMIRGGGISDGIGLAGYTNGEVIRNPDAGQDPYLARAFLRFTLPLDGSREEVGPDLLHIGGWQPIRRLVFTGGVLAATDIFDLNRYANSTRTQFLNWSFITNTAYDFPADTRGYTRGAAVEWIEAAWALRLGSFQMPTVANGLDLDGDLLHSHGDALEVEMHPTIVSDRPLVLRAMAYTNHARMGRYREALALAAQEGGPPDIARTREQNRLKYGFTLNLEQPLSEDGETGMFARGGWNDGATETFAYTEADWTVTFGGQLGGIPWRRADDHLGIAVAANGLSDAHADYLAAGGVGFELGDGRLRYRPETVFETYYLFKFLPWAGLTLDYQLLLDPGHNADRGPVSVVSLRAHLEGSVSSLP